MRIARPLFTFALLASAGVACSQSGPPSPSPAPSPVAVASVVTTAAAAPAATSSPMHDDDDLVIPTEKFSDPQKAFDTAKNVLLHDYYAAGLTEEDLYRAAVHGMLADVDPRMHRWNKLLSPSQYADLSSDLKGELVGIGVRINFDSATGHSDVLSTIPGSPAEKAGVRATDTIVSVNGKLWKGKTEHDVVQEIRGTAGEVVTLSILRDDKILPFSITRARVVFDDVSHRMIDGVGYVSIRMFSEKTALGVKAALDDFAAAHARAIALDLRGNKGGSFDEAVHSAELFLPAGTPIVTLEKREGKMETTSSKGTPLAALANVPVVVLIDHDTSSGAELVTGALSEGRHAKTVGTRTYGKWSVQEIEPLGNGYVMKYTTALFHAPSGKSYDGVGIAPDIEVDADRDAIERASLLTDPKARVAADIQLRTALSLVAP
jgi:carboxyl-terminal processing protease